MARPGLYLSDVREARDALRAQGKHPSIDAVRIALGNTGSKSTIHKLLRQLDEEEGDARPFNVSQELQSLVEELSARLLREATDTLVREREQMATAAVEQAEAIQELQSRLKAAEARTSQLQTALEREQTAHQTTVLSLQAETGARRTAEQSVANLVERIAEHETHRASLEEKHKHAREALEHFRSAAQEQREREGQRHAAEVQQLRMELRSVQQEAVGKQEEVSRLNMDAARLVADLATAQRALYAEQQAVRSLDIKLEQMRGYESQCVALTAQLEERKQWQALFEEQFEQLRKNAEAMRVSLATTQQELARAQVRDTARVGKKGKNGA